MDNNNPNQDMNDEYEQPTTMKQWLQDNLRIIVSVFVVVIIAAGIYSYSNRAQAPETKEQTEQSNLLKDQTNPQDNSTGNDNAAGNKSATDQKTGGKTISKEAPAAVPGQVTDTSVIETAVRGDGMTTLARKALADYLENNPDSSLTPEHKIYIEDYLRKNVSRKGRVAVGASVEFSKDLINNAVNSSKQLNARQLQNLHKYAVRVPSLT